MMLRFYEILQDSVGFHYTLQDFSLAYEKSKRRSSSTSKPIEQKVNRNSSGSRNRYLIK
jgi:hypothetical protein